MKHISTDDGSSSIYIEELKETYHSRHGALRESDFVYLKEGLNQISDRNEINILEVGMGTGLNIMLSIQWALQREIKLNLTTLEPFPIPLDLIEKLNYPTLFGHAESMEWWKEIHKEEWQQKKEINPYFTLEKHQVKVEDFKTEDKFDVIYYDAFGPHAQPELWQKSVFDHLATFCKKGTLLVTYCAQGQFKRNLRDAGFSIERLPGPPGKREMTRGTFNS